MIIIVIMIINTLTTFSLHSYTINHTYKPKPYVYEVLLVG